MSFLCSWPTVAVSSRPARRYVTLPIITIGRCMASSAHLPPFLLHYWLSSSFNNKWQSARANLVPTQSLPPCDMRFVYVSGRQAHYHGISLCRVIWKRLTGSRCSNVLAACRTSRNGINQRRSGWNRLRIIWFTKMRNGFIYRLSVQI